MHRKVDELAEVGEAAGDLFVAALADAGVPLRPTEDHGHREQPLDDVVVDAAGQPEVLLARDGARRAFSQSGADHRAHGVQPVQRVLRERLGRVDQQQPDRARGVGERSDDHLSEIGLTRPSGRHADLGRIDGVHDSTTRQQSARERHVVDRDGLGGNVRRRKAGEPDDAERSRCRDVPQEDDPHRSDDDPRGLTQRPAVG